MLSYCSICKKNMESKNQRVEKNERILPITNCAIKEQEASGS